MLQRSILRLGFVLVIFGCLVCAYIIARIADARLDGTFSTIVTDSPARPFQFFHCPYVVNKNQPAEISVTILNPTDDSLVYSLRLTSGSFRVNSTADPQPVTLQGNQTADISWIMTPIEVGMQAIAIEAISDRDAELPGPFHPWPTSFRQGCGFWVISGPFSARQYFILGMVSAILGTGLSVPWLLSRSKSRR
jgi:hypothetical protein